MKLRHVVAGVVGSLGLTAAGNRMLAAAADELEPGLPGDVGIYRWRGFDVAYVEAGDPENPDLLLLHGIHAAASNKEFDRIVEELAESYHVIAPDLPGFGLSDRPPLVYSSSLYEAFVADFARDVTEDAVCLASSLSGGYAVAVQRETAPFSRLVLVCPTADTGTEAAWARTLLRAPVVGTALFNLLTSKPSLRYFSDREAFYSSAGYTEADIDHYWTSAHQPGARFAPASFVGGALDPDVDLESALASLDVPVTLIWGEAATMPSLSEGRRLAETADVRLIVVEAARLLPHAEHPGPFLTALEEVLAAEPG